METVKYVSFQSLTGSATGNGTAHIVANYNSLAVQIVLGGTGTVNFECTVDGSNWVNLLGTLVGNTTTATSATASAAYQFNVSGLNSVRMRVSANNDAITVTGRMSTASLGGGAGGGGGGGSTTQYAEDAAHSSGDSVCVMGAVRKDTAASLAGATGDYTIPQTDALGNVRVVHTDASGNAMPAGDAAARKIYVGLANPLDYQDSICQVYDTVFNGSGTSYTVKSAIGNPASSGNNEIVALVSAKKIRVLGVSLQVKTSASAVVTCYFRTSTAGAAISPTWDFDSREGISLYPQKGYLFETVAGEALGFNISSANEVSVTVQYIEV